MTVFWFCLRIPMPGLIPAEDREDEQDDQAERVEQDRPPEPRPFDFDIGLCASKMIRHGNDYISLDF